MSMFIFCPFFIQNMLMTNAGVKKSPLIRQTFIWRTSGGRGESLRKSYIVYISSLFSPDFQQLKLILLR